MDKFAGSAVEAQGRESYAKSATPSPRTRADLEAPAAVAGGRRGAANPDSLVPIRIPGR